MREPALILVVDDQPANIDVLQMRLESQGYDIATAENGHEALARIAELQPDLVLLDVMMPGIDGLEVCRRVRADPGQPYMPIVMVTAKADRNDIVAGLDAGADDYLTKPVDQTELMARVRSMLRIKMLQDKVRAQADALAEMNSGLEAKVAEQVAEIGRMGELRRFLAPQVADLLLAGGDLSALQSHRREIVVVCCDLRGFTAFAEAAGPEEVMQVLSEYYATIGETANRFEATLDGFAGDGAILFFNDPQPVPDAAARALRMAEAMRGQVLARAEGWRREGYALGFGMGISQGEATLGRVGFDGRHDYTAIGTVVNLASRLCGDARDGEILMTLDVAQACAEIARTSPPEDRHFKGFSRALPVCNLLSISAGTG
ncbi:MAG: response regulator [Rhodobacteraceae bacterium]|nr:response regulator [Paracoccaceae bacterium]